MYLTLCKLDETMYVAWHPELRGCMSQGDTPAEAIANLAEAREVTLAHLHESHLPIPPPMDIQQVIIDLENLW